MDVCVLCQKGFDMEKESSSWKKLKTLIRITDKRELQELSRF